MRHARLAVAICLLAAPASALTPDELWQALTGAAGRQRGLALAAGAERRDGHDLILQDVTLTADRPGEGSLTATLAELALRGRADGGVDMVPAQTLTILGATRLPDGTSGETTGRFTQTGMVVTVTGTPESPVIDAVATRLAGTLSAGPLNGAGPAAAPAATGTLSADGIAFSLSATGGGSPAFTSRLSLGALGLSAETTQGPDPFTASLDMKDLVAEAKGTAAGSLSQPLFPGGTGAGNIAVAALDLKMKGRSETDPGDIALGLRGLSAEASADVGPERSAGAIPATSARGGFSLAEMTYDVRVPDPATGPTVPESGRVSSLSGNGAFNLPALLKDAPMEAALASGFSLNARLASGPMRQEFSLPDPAFAVSGATSNDSSRLELALSKAGFLIDIAQSGTRFTGQSAAIAGPIEVALKQFALRLAGPTMPSRHPEPFAFSLRLIELTAGDALWDLADPRRNLPRVPATFVADISGTGRIADDAFDTLPEADDVPFQPETLDITDLRLSVAGADLSGSGALSFRQTGGEPRPEGRIALKLTGAYALLDRIGRMGVAPPEAMFGLRGVLALIGKATGPDALVSDIEFRPDGTIWANGRRLPLD